MKKKKESKLPQIGRFNLLSESVCRLPCQCGWNIHVGGKDVRDLEAIKQFIETL